MKKDIGKPDFVITKIDKELTGKTFYGLLVNGRYNTILQTARIYSLALFYAFGGRSAVRVYAENVIGVQYIL